MKRIKTGEPISQGDGGIDLGVALAGVHDAIARERGAVAWLRALPAPRRFFFALLAVTTLASLPVAVLHDRIGPRWDTRAAIVTAACAALAVLLLRSALRPLHRAENRTKGGALVAAGLLMPFAMAGAAPGGAMEELKQFGVCFFIGSAFGWAVLLGLRAFDRGAHRNPMTALSAVGVAGVTANLLLQLGCLVTSAPHRLVCHATVGLALALEYAIAALVLGRRS